MLPAGDVAAYLGGFIAAEGCFTRTENRFRFAVGLGAVDRGMCDLLHELLCAGTVYKSPRRKEHYDDEVTFTVQSMRELIDVVIPFMDEHLPASYKRIQYERWREALLVYWENHAKRRRTCSEADCSNPRRAKGLCRSHYFQHYRR